MKPLKHASNAATLVELSRWRANALPAKRAYTFLNDGETEEETLSYDELDRKARNIGARLQSMALPGDRALLLYPPGLSYVAAFFGCLYAGIVAIPAYPPQLNRHLPRLRAMASDAQASLALGTTQIQAKAQHSFAQSTDIGSLRWLSTDDLADDLADEWREPQPRGETTALLQYTSGSTSAPKGVIVSHRNLIHNGRMIEEAFALSEQTTIVSWLPLYHDMGLIGNMIQSLYLGASCVLMSPATFLQRPYRWLKAISRFKADFSGGPNFAYDLCSDKVTLEERSALDLSDWSTAFNGAEPVRPRTLERFADAFGPCGFKRRAWRPVYGLAEGTLFVAGKSKADEPEVRPFQATALERHQAAVAPEGSHEARLLVGCGQTLCDQKIIVADPQSLTQCPPEQIGEIWLAGRSVAQGYWNKPVETAQTFNAYLADTGEGPFLRTGDLGFIQDNELFVTGRCKDLIIIRGSNHYPQDIELTVEQSHPGLRPGGGVAFTLEIDGEENLVIVHEVERNFRHRNRTGIIDAIRNAVVEQHGLEVYAIALIKTGSVKKTSSGKIQRQACREKFLSHGLEIVEEWFMQTESSNLGSAANGLNWTGQPDLPESDRLAKAIRDWLVSRIAERLKIASDKIDTRAPFIRFGIDSMEAIRIAGDLEKWMKRSLSPTLVYDYPNIEALANHLVGGPSASPATVAESWRRKNDDPIAIIGIGCRFPRAQGPAEFWRLLSNGVDAITEVPTERWRSDVFYGPESQEPGKTNTKWGGFLDGIDLFDPYFWGISPREAARIDPQQRLLLEVAWEALEDAGQVVERSAGARVGVFIGVSGNEYGRLQFSDPALIDAYAGTGNALSIAANRISYSFDWRGPSLVIDTACSSSLVAVHLACQSLNAGESTLALAGGVNLILTPALAINFTKAGVMAPDGRCKAFDERANGYVRSEGAGIVVLKRLSAALADGDPIYAVVLGTAVNQDGQTNGLMAPSLQAQEAMLEEAYRNAGVSPGDIQYVEAHGTGTALGDSIEAQALGAILSRGRVAGNKCAIGSVKTNIGHLEAAAGVAGLIKVALSLKHRAIPPSLHFQTPNPYIPFDALGLQVQNALSPWPEVSDRSLAGVSSFGFGGTNAHLVLAGLNQMTSSDRQATASYAEEAKLLTLSAHNFEALQSIARSYSDALSSEAAGNGASLTDFCFTANSRRSRHDYRLSLVGHSGEDLADQLERFLRGASDPRTSFGRRIPGHHPKLVFVFPGQGSQWVGMGRELLAQEPVFRETIELCDQAMRKRVNWSLLELLETDEESRRFDEIDVVQPAIFAIQIALASLWRAWGIYPRAVTGQSMGEVAAAYVGGGLSLEDAVKIICLRSRSLKRLRGMGAMAVVELSLEQARRVLKGYEADLSIAVSNSPRSTVLSGSTSALDELIGKLSRDDVFCRMINVDIASHSPQMDPLHNEILQALSGIRPRHSSIPIYSTVTGGLIDSQSLDAAYWMRNLREPVLFSDAIRRLTESGHDLFLEVSPHPLLLTAIKQGLDHFGKAGMALPSMRRKADAREVMLQSLGALFVAGYPVEWDKFYSVKGKCVTLPSYPWQRDRCWFEDEMGGSCSGRFSDWAPKRWAREQADDRPTSLDRRFKSAFPEEMYFWEVELDRRRLNYLNDYTVQGMLVAPTTTYIEMTMAAASESLGKEPGALSEIEFQSPMFLPENETRIVQIVLSAVKESESDFRIYSRPGGVVESAPGQWLLHANGKIHFRV